MSDGWVATQCSDHPRIARLRCSPSIAGQPVPASRLLQGLVQQVAARRGAVAQLAGRPLDERRGEEPVALAHQRMRGEIAVADAAADVQAACVGRLDLVGHQPPHVDEQARRLDAQPHQVDEVRTAAEEPRVGFVRQQRHRAGGVVGALVAERPHRPASTIAGTRFT
jgi:hypothetical protein